MSAALLRLEPAALASALAALAALAGAPPPPPLATAASLNGGGDAAAAAAALVGRVVTALDGALQLELPGGGAVRCSASAGAVAPELRDGVAWFAEYGRVAGGGGELARLALRGRGVLLAPAAAPLLAAGGAAAAAPTVSLAGRVASISPAISVQRGQSAIFYAELRSGDGSAPSDFVVFEGHRAAGWRQFLRADDEVAVSGLRKTALRRKLRGCEGRLYVSTAATRVASQPRGAPLAAGGGAKRSCAGGVRALATPRTVTYAGELGRCLGGGAWELPGGFKLFLSHYPGRASVGDELREGLRVRVHNAHPIYLRGRFQGLAPCAAGEVAVLRSACAASDSGGAEPSLRLWAKMSCSSSVWAQCELFPELKRKFGDMWSDAALLGAAAGSGSAREQGVIRHLVQILDPSLLSAKRCYSDEFLSHDDCCNIAEPPRAQLYSREGPPSIPAVADVAVACQCLADAKARELSGNDGNWGFVCIPQREVETAIAVQKDWREAPETVLLGWLCGSEQDGCGLVADKTGDIAIMFGDSGDVADASLEWHVWMFRSFKLIVEWTRHLELGAAAARGSHSIRTSWYIQVELASAECIFSRQPFHSLHDHSQQDSASADETPLWIRVFDKGPIVPQLCSGTERCRFEPSFLVQAYHLTTQGSETLASPSDQTIPTIQIKFSGRAVAHHRFLREGGDYEVSGTAQHSTLQNVYIVDRRVLLKTLWFCTQRASGDNPPDAIGTDWRRHVASLAESHLVSGTQLGVIEAKYAAWCQRDDASMRDVLGLLACFQDSSGGDDVGQLVNFRGVILARDWAPEKATVSSQRTLAGGGQITFTVQHYGGPTADTIDLQFDLSKRPCPNGLLPGTLICVRRATRRSQQGKVVCSTECITSITILRSALISSGGAGAARGGLAAQRDLAASPRRRIAQFVSAVSTQSLALVHCDIIFVDSVAFAWKCSSCGDSLTGGKCQQRCVFAHRTADARAVCVIDDGSGRCLLHVDGKELVRGVMGMPESVLGAVSERALQTGGCIYRPREDANLQAGAPAGESGMRIGDAGPDDPLTAFMLSNRTLRRLAVVCRLRKLPKRARQTRTVLRNTCLKPISLELSACGLLPAGAATTRAELARLLL